MENKLQILRQQIEVLLVEIGVAIVQFRADREVWGSNLSVYVTDEDANVARVGFVPIQILGLYSLHSICCVH